MQHFLARYSKTRPFARVFRGHHPDSKILFLFLVLSTVALSLVWLTSEIVEGDTLAIDRTILLKLRTAADIAIPVGPKWLAHAMVDITALGSVTVLTLITIVAVGYLTALHKRSMAMFVVLAVASGALLSSALKNFFYRARPDVVPHLVEVSSASFPSGHAMNSTMVYLTLATLLARSKQDVRVRVYLITIAIFLALLIGFSRVYLGVHWPSDVIVGWSLGALWAVLCSLAGKSLQQYRRVEGPDPPAPATNSEGTAPPAMKR